MRNFLSRRLFDITYVLALIAVSSGGLWVTHARARMVASAQADPPPLRLQGINPNSNTPDQPSQGVLSLSAVLSATDFNPVRAGVTWRIFRENQDLRTAPKMVVQTSEAAPGLSLPNGIYIVHASLGLAGVTKRVTLNGVPVSERLILNAGGLRVTGVLGDQPINPTKLSISIYVPERNNSEAKLVYANGQSGETIGLPEGNYHVVSTLLDAGTMGAANATNSVISADLRVQAGKLTDATLRHRAAVMTLKLVSNPGGEALANSSFTILTPGGDVIREMIGAFPSLTLAEGEYVAIARHNAKTFQTTFKVQSTRDRDVEILAR
jgi:hypothetical protein